LVINIQSIHDARSDKHQVMPYVIMNYREARCSRGPVTLAGPWQKRHAHPITIRPCSSWFLTFVHT